jgi:TRAP-type C4-dicarboxylate transport system permease small subunit
VLRRALERGDIPAQTPVELVLDSLYGAIVTWTVLGAPADLDEYAHLIVDFVLDKLPDRERV